jgi:hypothetical protein
MSTSSPEGESQNRPGRTRTWWHPLLTRILKWVLGDAYDVDDEVQVGRMPMRLDVVLLRRLGGELPEAARRELRALSARLNQFTLVEFKGPTAALETGDLDEFFALAHLFRSQQRPIPARSEMTLVILAPQITAALRQDVQSSNLVFEEHEPGVHSLSGAFFSTWMIETDRVSGLSEPILTFFSRVFLRDTRHIIEEWKQSGYDDLLCYVVQQIQQFRRLGEAFALQHQGSEIMTQTLEELKAAVIAELPPEDRLRGLTPEDRLRGLSPDDRLRGLSPDDRLRGLSPEELMRAAEAAMRKLSDEQRKRLLESTQDQLPDSDE